MIPKVIHYCWFGKNPKNKVIKKCINSWKKYCPEYEIIEWNEDNFDINLNNYVKEAYQEKKWAFVTDYVRLWIIYNYGGIYLDTDVELIKNIDQLLEDETFFCFENEEYIATGLGFGSKPKSKIVKKLLDDYKDIHFLKENGDFDNTPCPIRNTECIKDIINKIKNKTTISKINNIAFYPKEYFCPLDYQTGKLEITNNTIGIHWYQASWFNKNEKIKKNIVKFFKRILGKNTIKKIKSILKKEGR